MFKPNSLYYSDGYKVGHKRMLAPGIDYLYGTLIPRSGRRAPEGVEKPVSFGQLMCVRWLHDEFSEHFFWQSLSKAKKFASDMSMYLGMEYDGTHFEELHELGYLPIRIKALPEGIETPFNVPHMTIVNTEKGYAWLTLYLETILSALYWKGTTAATIALQYKRVATEWVMKTDPDRSFLIDYMCHDFSARGLDPFSMMACGLGHATSHMGSDTLLVIPASRYYYKVPEEVVPIVSVNASEHSVSTTKIFTVGEKQMIIDWLLEFPDGILSIVADTFDLWKLITEYLADPEVMKLIMERGARGGKLVIRPDSGDPVDIICGLNSQEKHLADPTCNKYEDCGIEYKNQYSKSEYLGVVELLGEIFGTTVNEQGYKILNPCIGVIYGDAINLERQKAIYSRLADKGYAATNVVLGIGSFTYQFVTRDTLGIAVKGAWFEIDGETYNIYKNPVTDRGDKKSLKGMCQVLNRAEGIQEESYYYDSNKNDLYVKTECTKDQEEHGLLKVIYEDGFVTIRNDFADIRNKIRASV